MKTVISAKLQLKTTPEQFAQLRATQLAYRDSLNFVSQYAYAHGKMSNAIALQKATYDDIRTRFHLPSQMACNVPRQVGATYKGLWTKVKKNAEEYRRPQEWSDQETLQRVGSSAEVYFSHLDLQLQERLQLQD